MTAEIFDLRHETFVCPMMIDDEKKALTPMDLPEGEWKLLRYEDREMIVDGGSAMVWHGIYERRVITRRSDG